MQKYQNIYLKKCLLVLCMLPLFSGFTRIHPFYLSVTEIRFNPDSKKLECSIKLFTDDFENALKQIHKIPIDLLHPKDFKATEKLVEDYILQNLQIHSNDQKLLLHFIGYEQEEGAIWSYFESDPIAIPKKINIQNTLLYPFIEAQVNIMHLKIGQQKKSYKLNNPNKKVEFQF